MHDCPYLVYSADVEPVPQSVNVSNSYAGATRAPRTVAFNSTSSAVSKTLNHGAKEKENRREKENSVSESSRSHERQESYREYDHDRERERQWEREKEYERRIRDRSHHHLHERLHDKDRYESRRHKS